MSRLIWTPGQVAYGKGVPAHVETDYGKGSPGHGYIDYGKVPLHSAATVATVDDI